MLAKAILRLEVVSIGRSRPSPAPSWIEIQDRWNQTYDISEAQSIALFNLIAKSGDEDIKLRKLSTGKSKLSHISPNILAEAVIRLTRIDLKEKRLHPKQVQSIFSKVAICENLSTRWLDISCNDLSSVPGDVLVKALSRKVYLDLDDTNLTPDQARSIFNEIANCENLSLNSLHISHNNLSSVSRAVLVKAISRLKIVELCGTDLTAKQVKDIFTLVAERKSSNLRIAYLYGNNVKSVPGRIRRKVEENCLEYCLDIQFDRDQRARVAQNCCLGVQ